MLLVKSQEMFSDIAVKEQDDCCKREVTRPALMKLRVVSTDDSSRGCGKKIAGQANLSRTPSKPRRYNPRSMCTPGWKHLLMKCMRLRR